MRFDIYKPNGKGLKNQKMLGKALTVAGFGSMAIYVICDKSGLIHFPLSPEWSVAKIFGDGMVALIGYGLYQYSKLKEQIYQKG